MEIDPTCPLGYKLQNKTCKCSKQQKRCPNGTRKNKDGVCISKTIKIKTKTKLVVPKLQTRKRCRTGFLLDKNGDCKARNLTPIPNKSSKEDKIIGTAIKSLVNKKELTKPKNDIFKTIQKEIIQQKSYSPSVNKRLVTINSNVNYQNIFGCGIEDLLKSNNYRYRSTLPLKINVGNNKNIKPMCRSYTTQAAQKVMLDNLRRNDIFNCENVVAPIQMDSNCWFNTMFVTFFISDKGRKFFRFFRQLMIQGKQESGNKIKNEGVKKGFVLLNACIEASYTNNDIALAMNTNQVITYIYNAINKEFPSKYEKIIPTNEPGNGFSYYQQIMDYLGNNSLKYIKFKEFDLINEIFQPGVFGSELILSVKNPNIPDMIVLCIYDNGKKGAGDSGTITNRKETIEFTHNGTIVQYRLDAVIIRDTVARHFSSLLTCNNQEMGFDGASFSRLSSFTWKHLLNKEEEWTFEGSIFDGNKKKPIKWNFRNGYQMLFYYRV